MAGIVGALNNKKFETFEEFYSQLQLRLAAEKNFGMFLSDPRMEDFMFNKVNELLKRRKNKFSQPLVDTLLHLRLRFAQ